MSRPHPEGPICSRCGERQGRHYRLAEDTFPWRPAYVCRTAVFERKPPTRKPVAPQTKEP